jgi:sugar phosphate isomerase/epimerase
MAGLAMAAWKPATLLFAREPELQFPTRPADRLALTSWPFRSYMESPTNPNRDATKPGMDIVGFAAMAIQRFNIHNINPLSAHFRSDDARYIQEVAAGVAKAGSRFVDLGLGAGNFFDRDASKRALAVANSKKWIDIAAVLGSPSVRQHLGGGHNAQPNVELAAGSLAELADYGAKKNIVVILENDDLVNEDPFFLASVIEKAGNSYLRALPDIGNTMAKGDSDYNYRGLEVMFKHAFNMSHVKDEVVSETGKVYKIDLARAFEIAKTNRYRGYFSMEWETKRGDVFDGTLRLVKETLQYI